MVLLICPGWIYANDTIGRYGSLPVTSQQQEEFLSSHLPTFKAYSFMNSQKDSNYVLYALYDENMAFFAKGVFMGDHFGVARYSDLLGSDVDGEALYDQLRRLGADYFLVNLLRVPVDFSLYEDKWFDEHFALIYADAPFLLYKLTEKPVKLLVSSELLKNSGFEEIENDLPVGYGVAGTPILVNSSSYAGNSAVKCLGTSNVLFQRVPVKEDTLYFLREFVRSDTPGQRARLQINWLDQNDRFISTSLRVIAVPSEWKQFEMWTIAPTGATQAQVYASPHENSVIYFDDLSFVKVTYGS